MSWRITWRLTALSLVLSSSTLVAQPPERTPAGGQPPQPKPPIAQPPQQAPRASLGIRVEPTPMDADKPGIMVREVLADSPAGKAGMKEGDLITKMDDKPVKDMESLGAALDKHKPGDKVTCHVLREGKDQTIAVTLGERPTARPRGDRGLPPDRATAFLGVQTEPLTRALKERLNVTVDQGVIVTEVVPNSPAAKAGLLEDDVITKFNGQIVGDRDQLRDQVRKAGPGKKVTIEAMRKKDKKEFTAELQEAPRDIFLPRRPGRDGNAEGRPGGGGDPQREIQRLQRQVEQLQKRIRDLEQKKPGTEPKQEQPEPAN